jgi:para-aminobenzoate synthetase component 1
VQRRMIERRCRPFAWLRAVADMPYPALLESAQQGGPLGRYSLCCWNPFAVLRCVNGSVDVQDQRTGRTRAVPGDPFRVLSREFAPYRLKAPGLDLPFAGGAVGYFSYDLRHRVEALPRCCDYDVGAPEFVLALYGGGLVFDHQRGVTEWMGRDAPPGDLPVPVDTAELLSVEPVRLESNFSREGYIAAVERVKEYIAAGDIFQANLAQRFSGDCPSDGLAVYSRLRHLNPAPFAAYLRYPELEVMSSSPERFLLVEGDAVSTRPIKGTRPRREGDDAFNRRMMRELQESAKDHAELTMIVDLERNDLGRVCSYGTVRVAEHATVETYSTVFHLVSTVTGRLHRPEHDEFSLLRATFPGGSITGAPKIRAMEIIEELEPHARNVYTGAIGYISFHGRMDLNIAIRTMVRAQGRVHVQVGGGIVADSVPGLEYQETLHKGRALFEALRAPNCEELTEAAFHGQR